ncbi:hypothetical protein WNY78_02560 [Psychroserpens sp. AS72]|uniref:hypothetical protein n=1 Tax=Psychroserpens sp. AS72 TaxID=3135775 RepID=UPI00316F5A76
MKAQSNIILMVLFTAFVNYTYAQKVKKAKGDTLIVGFSTGQASDNKYTKSLPASFIATYTENDTISNSYAINGYFGVDFKLGDKDSPKWKFSANAELHRNTLISKEQNTTQFGVSVNYLIPLFYSDDTKLYPCLILSPEFSFKHSDDKIKDKKGLQYLSYLSLSLPLSFENEDGEPSLLNFFRPNIIYPGDVRGNSDGTKKKYGYYISDWIQLKHFHSVGIEHVGYESLSMLNTSFGIEIYPLSGMLYNVFKQYGIFQFRYNIVNREEISSGDTDLYIGALSSFAIGLNYKFDKDGKTAISFGYEYNNGGNPLKGLDDNEFGQLKLSAIVNL